MNIFENRRKWLEFWIATKAGGSRSNFERKFGYSKSQITQFLSATYNDGRSIGDNAARKIEQAVGVADRMMDLNFEESTKASGGRTSQTTSSANIIKTEHESELALIHVDENEIRLLTQYRQANEIGRSAIEIAAKNAPKVPKLIRSIKK
jgi:hypothetical protein